MANNKLSWQELRKAVAEQANCTEKEAETFLNTLIESVIEGLKSDKQVKIKGLGAFALKAIAPRKSVNIATGEDFTIEGYNKLTFNAESSLKESVEKRTEKPATEEVVKDILGDPLKKLGEQADEIVDILAELGQAPVEVKEEKEVKDEKAAAKPKTKKAAKTPKVKEVQDQAPAEVKEEAKTDDTKAAETQTEKPVCKCKCKYWWCWLIGALLLAGGIGAGIYYQEEIVGWWQCTEVMDGRITVDEYHDIITSTKHIETEEIEEAKPTLGDHWNTMCETIESWNIGGTIVGWWESIKFWEKEEVVEEMPMLPSMPTTSGREVTPLAPRPLTPNPSTPTVPTQSTSGEIVYDRMPGIQSYYIEETTVEEITTAVEQTVEEITGAIEEAVTEALEAEVVAAEQALEEAIVEAVADAEEAVVEAAAEVEEIVNQAVVALADLPRNYTKIKATEIVDKNSRLTLIAQKYYGNKDLWVFIFEANRDILKNPGQISEGQKLRIPELDARYLDLNNPELRKLVDELTAEYVK